jgi:hypothetical protein
MDKMGCSPIFITPGHSQGNGLAERTIGTLKELIHKVAYEQQKSWWKHLEYILWALREIPQSSTGVAPWTMAFGFLPKGPCSILKDTWSGDESLPFSLDKSVADYLLDLRKNLEIANDFADSHIRHSQRQWINRYNLRARSKYFEVGDQVMILSPDSTSSRLWSRWRAPAKIIEKKSDHSYIVEIGDQRVHVHANKLRHYNVRVNELTCNSVNLVSFYIPAELYINTCSVIFERDDDFGSLKVFESQQMNDGVAADEIRPSSKIDASKLSHLSDLQRDQLLSVLDKYPECFADKVGYCNLYEHEIHVTEDFKPHRLKAYRIPEKLKPQVDQQIQDLLKQGIIRESNSPMASPLICVIKKDNSVRIVCDFRFLNKYTIADAIGPPDLSSVMQRIGRSKFISTFDGKSSYWTVPLKKEYQWLTAFTCDSGSGLYEWTRAAFGLKNSGCTFIRMINRILFPIRDFTQSFVDDLAVCSNEWADHLCHIELFLKRIKESGLTLNIRKAELAKSEVKFCGNIIGSGIRRIDPDKVSAVKNLKIPENKSDVRKLLGFFSWFRDFLPNFAEYARPLTDLTNSRIPKKLPWGMQEERAFCMLKDLLCKAVMQPLHVIDWDKPFNISTDASDHTIAGALTQTNSEGQELPISFFSRKLTDVQRNWPTVEKEAYAVLEALNKFRHWVLFSKIIVYSDHNPLRFLTESMPKSAKLLRWSLALQNYDITFCYKPGKSSLMAVPDCLSRMGLDGDEN